VHVTSRSSSTVEHAAQLPSTSPAPGEDQGVFWPAESRSRSRSRRVPIAVAGCSAAVPGSAVLTFSLPHPVVRRYLPRCARKKPVGRVAIAAPLAVRQPTAPPTMPLGHAVVGVDSAVATYHVFTLSVKTPTLGRIRRPPGLVRFLRRVNWPDTACQPRGR
jgi:hypothetical protein